MRLASVIAVASASALFLLACIHEVVFAPYSDQNFSPTKDVEIFSSRISDRPYVEIGQLSLRLNRANREDAVLLLKRKAQQVGADAIILSGEHAAGAIVTGAVVVPLSDLRALAIKYTE